MENFNKLKKWLNKENDNIHMFDKESRGLYSTYDIKNDDRIMEIPEKYILEYSNINDKKITRKLNNSNSFFAIYLLLKSLKKKTFWKTYIESFPENLDEYIYYYDKEKLSQLKHTTIMCNETYNFKIHFKNIKEDAKILYKWSSLKDKMDYEIYFKLFLKFRIYVCSRIFGYDKNNIEENGMVPYADLLNHSQKPNTTWFFDDSKKVFVVKATKNIPKNTEIFDSYGSKTNIQLIMYYGFSINNNKYSELNFVHKDILYTIDYKTNIKNITKKSGISKMEKILEHHLKKIENGEIKDNNILNIYNDEINIIKYILNQR